MDKRTVAGWVHHLEAPDALLTLSEFMALCLLHTRENAKDAREGTQHLEGMVGTLDEFLAGTNPLYQRLAANRAKTGLMSAGVVPDALKEGNDGNV